MSQQHDHAWKKFQAYIDEAYTRLGDRFVPVALICLQADAGEGPTDCLVHLDQDSTVLWPATFPIDLRGQVLKQMAQPYFDGTVLRGEQLDS